MKIHFALGMILVFTLVAPSTASAQPSDAVNEGGTQEVAVGYFDCSGPIPDRPPDDPVYGDLYVEIKGTVGIVAQRLEFSSELAPDSPAAVCESIAPDAAASIRSRGCTTGRVTFDTSSNNRRNGRFYFVCDGRRNQVINAVAGLAKQVLNVQAVTP
ncbi:MAG: hypothetical protein JRF15_08885 [Deltaproteobacteria bacterium]|nr:hypothetical protein [Deltaproteobacteria bacterium]